MRFQPVPVLQLSQIAMAPLLGVDQHGNDGVREPHPSISLVITPVFNLSLTTTTPPTHAQATPLPPQPLSLAICMTLESPQVDVGSTLFTLPLVIGNVPSQQYDKHDLTASDASGPLELQLQDHGNERTWSVRRATAGNVVVAFNARPRVVGPGTPPGPRVDLREQFGGLLGVGSTFLPLPVDRDSTSRYRCTLQWDLSVSPEGMRTVWSFGEGMGPIERVGSLSVLRDSIFGVGPLNSFVDSSVDPSGDIFNVYWFGNPEFDVMKFCQDTQKLYMRLTKFFGEVDSKQNSYRIFLRHTPRGIGGMAFQRSFIFEYDKDIMYLQKLMFPTLAHEMVHNWPLLGKEVDGSDQDLDSSDENWYSEGVAEYYSALLPYQFGLREKDYLLEGMNHQLSGYYTNPRINLTNKEATRLAWQDSNAMRIRYNRGVTYLYKVAAQVREKSDGNASLDTMIYELLERKRNGQSYKLKDWLTILHRELGQSGVDEYYEMANGKLVVPPADILTPKHSVILFRQDQELLELGFDVASINERVIRGVVPGTRAAESGLMDGDKIIANSFVWEIGDNYNAMMNLVVRRSSGFGEEEKEIKISYWPRAYEKVECYQVREATPLA